MRKNNNIYHQQKVQLYHWHAIQNDVLLEFQIRDDNRKQITTLQ